MNKNGLIWLELTSIQVLINTNQKALII